MPRNHNNQIHVQPIILPTVNTPAQSLVNNTENTLQQQTLQNQNPQSLAHSDDIPKESGINANSSSLSQNTTPNQNPQFLAPQNNAPKQSEINTFGHTLVQNTAPNQYPQSISYSIENSGVFTQGEIWNFTIGDL